MRLSVDLQLLQCVGVLWFEGGVCVAWLLLGGCGFLVFLVGWFLFAFSGLFFLIEH